MKERLIHLKELSETEKAYIAGIFDGEGSIFFRVTPMQRRILFTVTQAETGIELLKWLKRTTGVGSIVTHRPAIDNWQTVYRFYVYSSKASIDLIRAIRPYLIYKVKVADRALSNNPFG